MYDDTHWWYTEVEREQLKHRLASLSNQQRVVYSAGCVTHAGKVIAGPVIEERNAEFQISMGLWQLFWNKYPDTISGTTLASLASKAETVVTCQLGPDPDQQFLQEPAAEPLLWATLYALTLEKCNYSVDVVYSLLDRCYFAVYLRFTRDQQAINEGRMCEDELATSQCVSELRFQLNYLKMIEQNITLPDGYTAVSACSEDEDV